MPKAKGDWKSLRDADVVERFRPKPVYHRPLTDNHRRYMAAVESHSLTVCVGPAGTGKTHLACQVACKLLRAGKVQQIVVSRPLVECGRNKLGALPGGVEEKMARFIAAMFKALKTELGATEFERLKREERIQVVPMEQMRGETFDDSFVIIDEPQNADYEQLHMAATRIGHNCHLVLCGDLRQSDLVRARDNPEAVPLLKVARRLRGLDPDIAVCVMTYADVLRPPLVSKIDKALWAEDEPCDSSLHSRTSMIAGSTSGRDSCPLSSGPTDDPAPAPSYGASAATPARRSPNSSGS